MGLALSRTCNLRDFPNCVTVAAWQQALAVYAWAQWTEAFHVRTRDASFCQNWSGCEFTAPGPSAIYAYLGAEVPTAPGPVSAVWGLSVLDHTEAPMRFVTRAAELLRPRGLLFLTFAFWNAQGPDVAKGHEARTRIYDAQSWQKLMREAKAVGFEQFGGIDWRYHGHLLDDHTLASLVLTRR